MKCSTCWEKWACPSARIEVEAGSLAAQMRQIKDLRGRKGRRYEAWAVLTIMVLAKLAGQAHLSAIAHWATLQAETLQALLGVSWARMPCANTYRYIAERVEMEAVWASLVVVPAREERGACHLIVDGKHLRGANQEVVRLYDASAAVVWGQQTVTAGHDERAVAQSLVAAHDLRGCLLSADALHTQRHWCQQVRQQGGDYLLVVKGNQPTLAEDIATLFSAAPVPYLPEQHARQCDKGHGRLTRRVIRVSTLLNGWLAERWHDVAQVFQLTRIVTRGDRITTTVADGMTSLPPALASPARLLALVRHHWQIENRLHWRADATLREDRTTWRAPLLPPFMARLNALILALFDRLACQNLAAYQRLCAVKPAFAFWLLAQTF